MTLSIKLALSTKGILSHALSELKQSGALKQFSISVILKKKKLNL